MGKTKDKERQIAQHYFVKQGLDPKTIAEKLNLNIKTVYRWIKLYNWQELRTAELTKPQKRIDNIRQIIFDLAEQRLKLSKQIKDAEQKGDMDLITDLRKQLAQIDNSASYWNKVLTQVDKESQITLSQYLFVMEDIFENLKNHDTELFMKTLDFQEYHLQKIANRYANKK